MLSRMKPNGTRKGKLGRRSPVTAFPTLLLSSLTLACLCPPSNEALLQVGYRTPEQTFRTFQTALRSDQPDLEFRCLAVSFTTREGISSTVWREAREKLLREQPFIKFVAKAEIREVRFEGEEACEILAEIDTWIADRSFVVRLVREEFYEVSDSEGVFAGEERRLIDLKIESGDRRSRFLAIPMPEGLEYDDVTLARVGREWKIDGFQLLEEP